MRLKLLLIGAVALSACQVTEKQDDQSADGYQQVERNGAATAPEMSSEDQGNPESLARARDLAATFGTAQQRNQARNAGRLEMQNLRVEVDISDRKLRLFNAKGQIAEHDVAVGTEKWPTPKGSWDFHRVDINPEWNPPKSEQWAEDAETKAPGDPENPMGRARLVYRMPNTVHGTDDLNSLGKASSHGSIRVANEVALKLAEAFLKAGGAWEGPDWFRKMTENRTEEYQIALEDHIPIKVVD